MRKEQRRLAPPRGTRAGTRTIAVLSVLVVIATISYFVRGKTSIVDLVREVPASLPVSVSSPLPSILPVPVSPENAPTESASVAKGSGGGGSAEKPQERYLCRFIDKGIYLLPDVFLKGILSGKTSKILITDDEARCLRTGADLTLAFVRIDPISNVPYRHQVNLKGQATKIEDFLTFESFRVKYRSLADFGYDNPAPLTKDLIASYGADFFRQPLRAVEFNFNERSFKREVYGAPELHPLADSIAGLEGVGLTGQVLVDTRSAEEFKQESLVGAINIPVAGSEAKSNFIPYSSLTALIKIAPAALDSLPKDKKIVVFAENELSARAYNFISYLHQRGYRDLAFLRKGFGLSNGQDLNTPTSAPGIEIVDAARTKALIEAGGLTVVDTRMMNSFIVASLPNATRKAYREAKPPFRNSSLSMKSLLSAGETYSVTDLKGKSALLFYGSNNYDWRPLKAAIFSRDSGFSKIYWYRSGADDWRFHAALIGPEFKVNKNSSPENLRKAQIEDKPKWVDLYGVPITSTGPHPVRSKKKTPVAPVVDKSGEYLLPNLVGPGKVSE